MSRITSITVNMMKVIIRFFQRLKEKKGPIYLWNYFKVLRYLSSLGFLVLVSFGQFIKFCNFCEEQYSEKKQIKDDFYLLQGVKDIRNACACNNCILNDKSAGKPPVHKTKYSVTCAVGNTSIGHEMARSKLSNDRLIQLTITLYMHK